LIKRKLHGALPAAADTVTGWGGRYVLRPGTAIAMRKITIRYARTLR
jgi:hypothetical protein